MILKNMQRKSIKMVLEKSHTTSIPKTIKFWKILIQKHQMIQTLLRFVLEDHAIFSKKTIKEISTGQMQLFLLLYNHPYHLHLLLHLLFLLLLKLLRKNQNKIHFQERNLIIQQISLSFSLDQWKAAMRLEHSKSKN